MSRASRLLRLVQALRRHRQPVTAAALARELEVSIRTVYRDVAALNASRVPINGEAGVGYVLGKGCDLPPMMFTPDEIEAVMVGMSWLEGRGDAALARAAQDVLAKVGSALPENARPLLFGGALFAPVKASDAGSAAIDAADIRRAIREGRKAAIRYADGAGAVSERVIWPFGMAFFDTSRVILAWCELRADFRHFRVDRIASLQTGGKFPARNGELLRRWKGEAIGRDKRTVKPA